MMDSRILSGAIELFSLHGIKGVSMDDIAKHLSISKKTIYRNYEDKNSLVEQLMKSMLHNNQCNIDKCGSEAQDAIEEGIAVVDCVGKMIGSLNPSFFYDMQKYHPEIWEQFKKFREEYVFKKISNTLQRGINEQLFRADIHIGILARMRIEQIGMIFNPKVFPPGLFNPRELMMETTLHFMYGVATIKGHQLIDLYLSRKKIKISSPDIRQRSGFKSDK